MQPIRVETYSGYKADEFPRRFWLGGTAYEIIEIEDRWYGPGYEYFRVFADDAVRYVLKKNIQSGSWELARSSSKE